MLNLGRVLEFAYFVAFLFFILSVFVFPISLAYWRAREKQRAAETEATLKSLGFDHTHRFEQDAL